MPRSAIRAPATRQRRGYLSSSTMPSSGSSPPTVLTNDLDDLVEDPVRSLRVKLRQGRAFSSWVMHDRSLLTAALVLLRFARRRRRAPIAP